MLHLQIKDDIANCLHATSRGSGQSRGGAWTRSTSAQPIIEIPNQRRYSQLSLFYEKTKSIKINHLHAPPLGSGRSQGGAWTKSAYVQPFMEIQDDMPNRLCLMNIQNKKMQYQRQHTKLSFLLEIQYQRRHAKLSLFYEKQNQRRNAKLSLYCGNSKS